MSKKKKATESHRIVILDISKLDTSKLRGTRPPDWTHIFNRDITEEMLLHGSTTPDEWRKIWKSAIPLFDPNMKGQVIITGTSGNIDGDNYFKKLWDKKLDRDGLQ